MYSTTGPGPLDTTACDFYWLLGSMLNAVHVIAALILSVSDNIFGDSIFILVIRDLPADFVWDM